MPLVPLVPLERELLPRDRVPLPRDLADEPRGDLEAALLRDAVLRDDLAAPLLERFEAEPADLRELEELPELAAEVLPREPDFVRPSVVELELRDELPRPLAERVPLDRLAVERDPADLRAPVERVEPLREEEDPELPAPPEVSPGVHLPDITRCAASATASAIIDPSLVALATTLLAACDAVSAASSPASRIFLRAAGLALIAAAAAASPAASISLLIAALVSLSTVVSLDSGREDVELERELAELEREELLRVDLAIANLPPSRRKTL